MKLYILSDLHLEFGDFAVPRVDCDAVVIAGDLHVGLRGLEWAASRLPSCPILYVLGNHEYYGGAIPKLATRIAEAAAALDPRIRVLNKGEIQLGDVVVFGATLWTDFELHGEPRLAMFDAQDRMTDFNRIRVSPRYRRLRPADTRAMHGSERRWLAEKLRTHSTRRSVVVTHHAPSKRSLPRHLRDDPLAPAYASALDGLVQASGAELWVHGHCHFAVDYRMGETRVISNPRGYLPDDLSPGFRADLVVEV